MASAVVPTTSVITDKNRFVFLHVWKTGGTELCRLARAHGWHVPPAAGCSLSVWDGWPKEDYDMFGHESVLVDGPRFDYLPKNNNAQELEVHHVQWITILRHPYSRSLSHFYHVFSNLLKLNQSITMEEFFRGNGGSGLFSPQFDEFIRDQQTRWHCGSDCSLPAKLRREHLQKARDVLNKFHAVLILEDMQDPESCTRRLMRHVLNFTLVLDDFVKQRQSNIKIQKRQPGTRWDDQVFPFLNEKGHHVNNSLWGNKSVVMAELGIHNEIDLQFYGYAQQRCEELAKQFDQQQVTSERDLQGSSDLSTASSLLVIPKSCLPPYYPWFLGFISIVILNQLRILRRLYRNRRPWKEN